MLLKAEQITKIARRKPSAKAVAAIAAAQNEFGPRFGLDLPHRLAQWLGQLAVESGDFTAFVENLNYTAKRLTQVWPKRFPNLKAAAPYAGNPEALANKTYGGRMGNTRKGDGWLYRGRGPKMITGRDNYRALTKWAKKYFDDAPDFEADPDMLLQNPWAGLSAIWFWVANQLNDYADQGDFEMITKRINGGTIGFDDRADRFGRAALVLLGKPVDSLKAFQKSAGLTNPDGDPGPRTRAALHRALLKLAPEQPRGARAAPVVEETIVKEPVEVPVPVERETKVPVKAANLDKPFYKDLLAQKELGVAVAGTGAPALFGAPWQTVAVVGLVLIASALIYYFIRRTQAAKQNVAIAEIKTENAVAESEFRRRKTDIARRATDIVDEAEAA
jgi:putative chitinase